MPECVPADLADPGSQGSRLDVVGEHDAVPPRFAAVTSENVIIRAHVGRLPPERQKSLSNVRIDWHWLTRRFRFGFVNLALDYASLNQDGELFPFDVPPPEAQDFTYSEPQASGD